MNQKEFNSLLNNIAENVHPLNQLLYQSVILVVFYYIFDNIKNIKHHKSFIILIAIICIILDIFIWSNITQTTLFIAILIIYITYNINRDTSIDTFINTINNIKNSYNDTIQKKWAEEEIENRNRDEINKITFIPNNMYDYKNNSNNSIPIPEPFDKSEIEINKINVEKYQEDISKVDITDSQYATLMLNKLYNSSQYKNIKKDIIDKSLNSITIGNNTIDNNNTSNSTNLNLFTNPEKNFLDNRWLYNVENTYNDSCNNRACTITNKNSSHPQTTNPQRNQNAICTLAKFGYKLSECTNQENTISDTQLQQISSNNITIINVND